MRWYGDEEEGIVKEVFEMEVAGRRPVGMSIKSWRRCLDEELDQLGIRAEYAHDRREWRPRIRCLPQRENLT